MLLRITFCFLALFTTARAEPARYGRPGNDVACAECNGRVARVTATSTLTAGKRTYAADSVIDGNPATAWCEGVAGRGVGEALTFTLEKRQRLVAIEIAGGYFKDATTLANNGRMAKLVVEIDGGARTTLELVDPAVAEKDERGKPVDRGTWFTRAREIPAMFQPDAWTSWGATSRVRLIVDGVYGGKVGDTCISEVRLYLTDP